MQSIINFFEEATKWITDFGGQWHEFKTDKLLKMDSISDSATLFIVAFLIVAKVLGYDEATKWIGLVFAIWFFFKFYLMFNGVI